VYPLPVEIAKLIRLDEWIGEVDDGVANVEEEVGDEIDD